MQPWLGARDWIMRSHEWSKISDMTLLKVHSDLYLFSIVSVVVLTCCDGYNIGNNMEKIVRLADAGDPDLESFL